MNSIFRTCCRLTIGFMLLTAPLLGYGAWQTLQRNANSPIDWMPTDFPARLDYERFHAAFESGDVVVVSWPGCTIDDPRLEKFGRVASESAEAHDTDGRPYFSRVLTASGILRDLTSPPLDLPPADAVRRLQGSLIGPDGRSACAVVVFTLEGLRDRARAVPLLRRMLAEDCGVGADDQRLAGPIMDGLAVDVASLESLNRFAGPSSLVIFLLVWRCLKSWRAALLVFLIATYCQLASLALVHFCGEAMNAVLIVMPPLVLVLGVSGGIHLVNYLYDAVCHGGHSDVASRAVRLGWVPCALSSGTTAIGLASLMVSDIMPIRQFGFYGAFGVSATFVMLFLVLPGAFEIWPGLNRESHPDADSDAPSLPESRLMDFIRKYATPIVVVSFTLLLATGWGVPRIKTSVRIQTLFGADSRILTDYRWIENHVVPLVPIEVIVHCRKDCSLTTLERLALVQRVENRLAELPEVRGTLSAMAFLPKLTDPGGAMSTVARTVLRRKLESNLDRFVELRYLSTATGEQDWRVTARVSSLADIDYGVFLREVHDAMTPITEEYTARGAKGIDITSTGAMPLVHEVQRGLVNDLFSSFLSALVLITLIMMLVERGVAAGLVSMIPNFFPVVLLFGLLGWIGRPMDIGSIMTASIALGMAIDGTLHYLTFYRRDILKTDSPDSATHAAYAHCAAAMTESTVVCGFGLMPFALSEFLPTSRFPWMILWLIWVALIGDLLVLPALLLSPLGRFFRRRRGEKAPEEPADSQGRPRADGL